MAVDGTHLPNLPITLLLAGVRAADSTYDLIGFGFTRSETTDDWVWFMKTLIKAFPQAARRDIALITDRQKGLESRALSQLLKSKAPRWLHLSCAFHILRNVKGACGLHLSRSHRMDGPYWEMVKTRSKKKSIAALARIKDIEPKAAEYLAPDKIPPIVYRIAWSTDYSRDGYSTSNIVEALNGTPLMLEIRQQTAMSIVMGLDEYMQRKRFLNAAYHKKIADEPSSKYASHQPYSKAAARHLDRARELAVKVTVRQQSDDIWVVLSHDNVPTVQSTVTVQVSSTQREPPSSDTQATGGDKSTARAEEIVVDSGGDGETQVDEDEEIDADEEMVREEHAPTQEEKEEAEEEEEEGEEEVEKAEKEEGETEEDEPEEEATGGYGKRRVLSCTCAFEPELDGFPCPCIVAVAIQLNIPYTDGVPSIHLKKIAQKAYIARFKQVAGDELRSAPTGTTIKEPPSRKKPGRPGRKARKRKEKGSSKPTSEQKKAKKKRAKKEEAAKAKYDEMLRSLDSIDAHEDAGGDGVSCDSVDMSDDSSIPDDQPTANGGRDKDHDKNEGQHNTEDLNNERGYPVIELTTDARGGRTFLELAHKLTTRVTLTARHKHIIYTCDRLEDEHIIAAAIMMKNKFPSLIDGIADPVGAINSAERNQAFTGTRYVKVTTLPAVRFIHLPGHWVVAWRLADDEPLYYYDSLDPDVPTTEAINDLTFMFAVGDEEVDCVNMEVKPQRGVKVCGVRAILAAYLALDGRSPEDISGLVYPINQVLYEVRYYVRL